MTRLPYLNIHPKSKEKGLIHSCSRVTALEAIPLGLFFAANEVFFVQQLNLGAVSVTQQGGSHIGSVTASLQEQDYRLSKANADLSQRPSTESSYSLSSTLFSLSSAPVLQLNWIWNYDTDLEVPQIPQSLKHPLR